MSRSIFSFPRGFNLEARDNCAGPRSRAKSAVPRPRKTRPAVANAHMAPDHNGSDGVDGFILIDSLGPVVPAEDVYRKAPIKGGYVKIMTSQTNMEIEKETNMLHIDGFDAMPRVFFPEWFTQYLLKAADPTDYQATGKAAIPHIILIKNAIAIFEGFFFFSITHTVIGRSNLFALVGKACSLLDDDDFVLLQQYVGSVMQTLSDARKSPLRVGKGDGEGEAVTAAAVEDPEIGRLIALVDRYIEYKADEPIKVDENWVDHYIVKNLLSQWNFRILTRLMVVVDGIIEKASIGSTGIVGDEAGDLLLAATIQATSNLQDALRKLSMDRDDVPDGLNSHEQHVVKKVLRDTVVLTSEISQLSSQAPPADSAQLRT